MPALSYYSNVHNTALNMIVDRGYQIWFDEKAMAQCAEKDGWDFWADDPVQLLGIIAIFETIQPSEHKEYWWKINEPWLLDKIPSSPKPFKRAYGLDAVE